jgi:hypothetical protein
LVDEGTWLGEPTPITGLTRLPVTITEDNLKVQCPRDSYVAQGKMGNNLTFTPEKILPFSSFCATEAGTNCT